jgi:hypothetical protein
MSFFSCNNTKLDLGFLFPYTSNWSFNKRRKNYWLSGEGKNLGTEALKHSIQSEVWFAHLCSSEEAHHSVHLAGTVTQAIG